MIIWDNITGTRLAGFKGAKIILKARRSKWLLVLFNDSRRGWFIFEKVVMYKRRESWSFRSILDNNITTSAGDAQDKADKFIREWAVMMSKVTMNTIRRRIVRNTSLMRRYKMMWKKPKLD
jgi:hypothetical protein